MRVREHAPTYTTRPSKSRSRKLPSSRRRRFISEAAYLNMNGRWEYDHGVLEKVPVPITRHQEIIQFLSDAWTLFRIKAGGRNLPAGEKIRLGPEKYRDPDLTFYLEETYQRVRGEKFMSHPDWVLEVSSNSKRDRHRDFITKREEYAKAGIPEYWIVDPKEKRIYVFVLENKKYRETIFSVGAVAQSEKITGFKVDVTELFEFARL